MFEPRPSLPSLTADLVEFLQSGLPMNVGTCDAERVPAIVTGFGVRIDARTNEARVLIQKVASERPLRNLKQTGQVAAVFARPIDHRSFQLKGRFLGAEDATAEDRALWERYRDLLVEHFALIGIPRSISRRLGGPDCVALRFTITGIFEQTPGPSAGRALGS